MDSFHTILYIHHIIVYRHTDVRANTRTHWFPSYHVTILDAAALINVKELHTKAHAGFVLFLWGTW